MNLYEMKVLDSYWFSEITCQVIRVPGGWIFQSFNADGGVLLSSCFVPFDNEFMENSAPEELAATVPGVPAANTQSAAIAQIADNMERRINQQPVSVGELIRLIELSCWQLRAL